MTLLLAASEAEKDPVVLAVVFGAGIIIFLLWAVSSTIKYSAREKTKRELFAYVAEGAIDPEQAEKLMAASDRSAMGKVDQKC